MKTNFNQYLSLARLQSQRLEGLIRGDETFSYELVLIIIFDHGHLVQAGYAV